MARVMDEASSASCRIKYACKHNNKKFLLFQWPNECPYFLLPTPTAWLGYSPSLQQALSWHLNRIQQPQMTMCIDVFQLRSPDKKYFLRACLMFHVPDCTYFLMEYPQLFFFNAVTHCALDISSLTDTSGEKHENINIYIFFYFWVWKIQRINLKRNPTYRVESSTKPSAGGQLTLRQNKITQQRDTNSIFKSRQPAGSQIKPVSEAAKFKMLKIGL